MTGYQYIKQMTVDEIDRALGCGKVTARNIKKATLDQLVHSCHTCPQLLEKKNKWPCNFQLTSCKECMKTFLQEEVPGTPKMLDEPCLKCMELDLCQGEFGCMKLEAWRNGER